MENSSEVLHTMERLVSSLLQASSGAAETIRLGVHCRKLNFNEADAWFPSWETNNTKDDFKDREAVFTTYPKVSVVFKGTAGKPDQIFDGTVHAGWDLAKVDDVKNPNNRWTLVHVKTTANGGDPGNTYGLEYSCGGMQMDLEERTYIKKDAEALAKQRQTEHGTDKSKKKTPDDYYGGAP